MDIMKRTIDFFIPVVVKPKQSYRARRGGGYTDPKIKQNAKDIAKYTARFRPDRPLEGPISVMFVFVFPYTSADRKQSNPCRYPWKAGRGQVGDYDNLAKQIGDILQQQGFFANDAAICDAVVRKRKRDEPGVHVTLSELED